MHITVPLYMHLHHTDGVRSTTNLDATVNLPVNVWRFYHECYKFTTQIFCFHLFYELFDAVICPAISKQSIYLLLTTKSDLDWKLFICCLTHNQNLLARKKAHTCQCVGLISDCLPNKFIFYFKVIWVKYVAISNRCSLLKTSF